VNGGLRKYVAFQNVPLKKVAELKEIVERIDHILKQYSMRDTVVDFKSVFFQELTKNQ
jgi:hypothetical protein